MKKIGLYYKGEEDFAICISEYSSYDGIELIHAIKESKSTKLTAKLAVGCLAIRDDLKDAPLYLNSNNKTYTLFKDFSEIVSRIIPVSITNDYTEVQKLSNLILNDKVKFVDDNLRKEVILSLNENVKTRKLSNLVGSVDVLREMNPTDFHHADVTELARRL